MKLTQNHIQELYKFTRAHFVEHYDLQTELVDHLANGIERQWEQDPSLTFEEAKQKEFKKFGVFGFMDVVTSRKNAMGKKYRAIIWGYFQEWWSLPKILCTITVVLVIFLTLRALPNGEVKLGIIAGAFLSLSILMLYRSFQLKRSMGGLYKKWMLQEMIFQQGAVVQLFIFPVHFLNLGNNTGFIENYYGQLILALLMVILLIMLNIIGYVIPSKAHELLAETYAEYKIK